MPTDTEKYIEQAKESLITLHNRLREIENIENTGINIFGAVGMKTQEIKHSAFLAYLLNPKQKHGLGNAFLINFLEKLISRKNGEAKQSNSQILGLNSVRELKDFFKDDEISVLTEKTLYGNDSRIDIFIESQASKTVIVIENKVFTTTHDNQLTRYEEKLSDRNDWKKLFIYLTPKGDMPTEKGEYRGKWCIFSYKDVLQIINEFLNSSELKRKENLKLKFLMEDYIELVETNILKENRELKSLCKQIRKEHKAALEILMSYTDNADEVMAYCAEWIRKNVKDVKTVKATKRYIEMYTTSMEVCFLKNGEAIMIDENRSKFRITFGYSDTVGMGISLQKGEVWSLTQKNIMQKLLPDKSINADSQTFAVYSDILVPAKEREMEFESLKPQIDEKLKNLINKINSIEVILSTL